MTSLPGPYNGYEQVFKIGTDLFSCLTSTGHKTSKFNTWQTSIICH